MARSIFDTVSGESIPTAKSSKSIFDYNSTGGNPQVLGRFGVGESKHDWGISEENVNYLQDIRAAHQTVGEQFVGFLNQAVVGEIAGGTIEGIGYMLDLGTYGNLLSGTEKEFGNWFSDLGKDLRTWSEEATPIYVDPDQAKFAPGHASWWLQNGKSVASTLSLMIPSGVAVKGISAIGKAIGAFQKIKPMTAWAARGIGQAAISRHMENMMEASGTYKEMYDKGLQKGMSATDAEEYAAKAASKTYALDWAMFLQDVPQYLLLNRAFGKASVGLAEKSIAASLAMGNKLAPVVGSKAAAIGWDMLGEGFEEGYQFIASEEAKYLTDKIYDPTTSSSFDSRLNKYLKDGEFWTNAAMGALGAGVMQTAGKAINDLIQGGDPQAKFVKEFGSKIGHAAQQVQFSDLLGSESGKRAAITNLEQSLFSKAAALGQMDDVKELIKRSANPSQSDVEQLGIKPEEVETLQMNHEEILKHADEYEKRWEDNYKKYGAEKGPSITAHEFAIDRYNEYKSDYKNRLEALKDKITNFNALSLEAQDIFGISSQILANQKRIEFQQKRIADTKNPLDKRQIELANKLIKSTEKENNRLKSDLTEIEKSLPTYRTEKGEEKRVDDDIDIGGPYNLLNAKDEKEIIGHAILEHNKVSEALAFADDTLKAHQQWLKEAISGKKDTKKEPQPKPEDDLARIPETDDYVIYNKDGKEFTGIVDGMDEDGNYIIVPTEKHTPESKYATKPVGEPVVVSKDKVVLDKKQYIEEDINEEPLSLEEVPTVTEAEEDTSTAYLDVAYMFDDGGVTPTVSNEDLHRWLVDPKNTLDGVVAEMHIDTTSDYAKEYWKSKGIGAVELRRLSGGKLTDNDINELFAKASVDTIPVAIILVKDGKVLHKGGMFYHETSFRSDSVPQYVKNQGADATTRYINNRKQQIRTARWTIIPNLLKGNEVYSDTLTKTNGHYNNSTTRGNVLERHGLAISNARLAVSRKNGRVYISNANTIPGLSANTAGNIFAPTSKTIDGKENWAKVNPTKLTREHAEILWDAMNTRFSKGKGQLAPFPDDRVQGLNVGEVITMLTLTGQRKTNIDHENFKGEKLEHLRNKALYVDAERNLVFGTNKVNIYEDDIKQIMINKEAFIKWATENKNYSIPIGIKPMGIELNSPLKRTFKIGAWENKADEKGNFLTMAQFLMSVPVDGKNKLAVESDLQEYEGTGSAFVRPNLLVGDNINAIKVKVKPDAKPKVPKKTTKSNARAKTTSKVKQTQSIDSPIDLVNLPVGAEIYYMSRMVKEGVVTEDREPITFAKVIFDKKLGRVLDLRGFQSNYVRDTWGDWLMLEHEDSFKSADAFVSYLKSRPHIEKVLVDVSNIVEDKVQVEPTPVSPDVATEVKTETPTSTETSEDVLKDIFGVPMMADFSEPVKSIVDLPKELAWFHERFGKQNVQESDKLLTIASNGRKAFSVFTADAIFVFTGAPEGALYHEAFHRVLLGYLSEEDRQKIYASARKQFGDLSEYELSERMAEDFRAYKLNGTKPKSRTIWQFFKDLFNFISTFFTGNTKLMSYEIDKLYDSIDRGQFKYSKISADNLKRLEGIQVPMAVDIRKTTINTISNHHELNKVVKFLGSVLIQVSDVHDLNDIKNINFGKLKDRINVMINRLQQGIINDQKRLDDNLVSKEDIDKLRSSVQVSTNFLNVLQTVVSDEYSQLFIDKISDWLRQLNVKRIVDEDNAVDAVNLDNFRGAWDKRASYEINSKDNILASVKFLIATLPVDSNLDPHIGIPNFVDFNEMWSSLMYHLYDINDTEEMMDRLKEHEDKYPYKVLISKLEADKSGLKKEQLRTSVMRHRHNFVNFLLSVNRDGLQKIEITNADVSRASVTAVRTWNLFFYADTSIVDVKVDGIDIIESTVAKIYDNYNSLLQKVDKEYKKNKTFVDRNGIISVLTSLLNRISIDVDELTVDDYITNRSTENKDENLFQAITNDFNYIFSKVRVANQHDPRKIFGSKTQSSDEKYVKALAESYINIHPELISDVILGPSNNQYYVYAQNSYVSDKIRKFRSDKSFLEDHLNKTYNDNSYYGKQMLGDDKVRQDLEILTFAMFGRGSSSGMDYLDINPIEDYLFKMTAMSKGLIPFPTMADRKTYYLLKGVKPFDFKYTPNADGTYTMPSEAIDILLGYAKSERNRINKAKETRAAYEAAVASGNEESIAQLERGLVEGYHYILRGKVKVFDKGAAYIYHNFPSFNREGFDFDATAREEIRQSITNNIREELAYVESLGLVGSTLDSAGKRRYYNRLIDKESIAEGVKNYGTTDMAIKNMVASFFVNTIIANAESEKLFSGDPAFYKTDKDTGRVIEDKVKRLTVLPSTGDNFAGAVKSQGLISPTFNVVSIATQKYQSVNYKMLDSAHMDMQKRRLKAENPDMSDEDVLSRATEIVSDTLKGYREMDPTDGQAWISPEMYRSLAIRLGEWSDAKDEAFNLLQQDRELTQEEEKKVLAVTLQPLKLVYFDFAYDGSLAIPTYYKASFTTIFRAITKGKHGDRQIVDMLDRMEGKGRYQEEEGKQRLEKVDMFVMDSATKVGNRSKFYVLDDNLEEMNDLSKAEVYKQSFSGLRRQLVTDAHDVDRTKTGTQFLKIALSNLIVDEEVYEIGGRNVNGAYIRDAVFSSLNSLSNRGRKELEDRLGYSNGRIDKAKLVALLVEDAKKSNASDNLIDAISMMGDDMYLELDSLTDRKWIQNRIISLIAKHTIDVKLPGNQFVQFANFGMRSVNKNYNLEEVLKDPKDKHIDWVKNATDDLQFLTLEDGKVVPMGAIVSINLFKHIIPNYDNISYKDKLNYVRDNPEIMGYRIPTQGQNSIFMLKIVGIYPEAIGDTITLPSEFTALTGSDFDIDKVYAVRYNYTIDRKNNKFEKIKFIDGDTNDEVILKRIYEARYGKVARAWRDFVVKLVDPEVAFSSDIMSTLNSIGERTDSIEVEELIKKLVSSGKYDGAIFNRINELLMHTEEGRFVTENKGKNIYDVNSRKAVENRLIDSFFSVMRSEAHFESTSAPLGSLTDKLKKKAQKIRETKDTTKLDMYYLSPRFNESVKHTYNGGMDGVGPFALNNSHHVLAQLAGLKMNASFGDVMIHTDGKIDLSKSRGKDGIMISNWLSALIDAHVDVAKDPYIMDLNVNSFTYNTIALLIRGGAGEAAFDFVAQPILRELATETLLTDDKNNELVKSLTIEDGLDEENQPKVKHVDADTYIKHIWESKLTKEELDEVYKQSLTDAFSDNLAKDLTNTDETNKDFIKRQVLVFRAFKEKGGLYELGTKLNTLVQASQVDTKRFGSNITELRAFMNKIRKAYDEDMFINIEKVLPFNPDTGKPINVEGANFLGTYAANAIKFSLDMMGDVSIYGTPVFDALFEKIVKTTGNEYTLDTKFINILSDEIFAAIVAKFFTDPNYVGINSTKLYALINSVLQKFASVRKNKDGEYDNLQDNYFIKYLSAIATSDPTIEKIVPMFVSVPMKSTKDKADKDNMIGSFKELLKDDRADVRALARQLFYYAFFTSGFRSRIYSFFSLLPNEMFKEITVKSPLDPNQLVDRSYNKMIKQILAEMKNIMNVSSYNSIVEEVLINNHDNDNLIKYVNDRGIETMIYDYKGKRYDRPIAVELKQDMTKYLLLGYNDSNQAIFRPYIKIHDSQLGHIILRYIGYINETADNKTTRRPVYVTQNMRSYNAKGIVIKEFNMDKSIIPAYNELNVITPAMEEDFISVIAANNDFVYVPKDDQLALIKEAEIDTTSENNKVTIASELYTKDTPKNKELGFFFTENLQAYLANRNRLDEQSTEIPQTSVKLNVTATNNQAGIRTDINGKKNDNAFAIISKKFQHNVGSEVFVKEEGQFKDTNSDFDLFKRYNTEAIQEALDYGKPLIIPGGGIATGKSALPLNFVEWLKNKLETDLGITGTIKENTTPGYSGYGIFNLTYVDTTVKENEPVQLDLFEQPINTIINEKQEENQGQRQGLQISDEYRGVKKVISGLQTGVDTIGLEIANGLGIETGGTTTINYGQENGTNSKDIASKYNVMAISQEDQQKYDKENSSETQGQKYYKGRTEKNVLNSDGTVYFTVGSSDTGGFKATESFATKHNKPFILNPSAEQLIEWIKTNKIETLNVAGNRGSKVTPAFDTTVRTVLEIALKESKYKEDEYPFLSNTPGERFSTEKHGVSELVKEMGIIDWTVVTADQWKKLREEYKHCNL